MTKQIGMLTIACLCTIITGCANLDSIHHTFAIQKPNGESPDSVSIDAKQRVVLSGMKIRKEKIKSESGTDIEVTVERPIVCAEPSPDALAAIAQGLSAKANISDVKALELAFGQTESAAYIGLRTQTIQLLRDGMYRLCEGYMSGALNETSFNRLQRRYQNLMLGLLSVEQLTGAVVAPQLALTAAVSKAATSSGSGDIKKKLNEYALAKIATEDAAKALQEAEDAAKAQKDAVANATPEKKDEETKKLVAATAAVKERTVKKRTAEIEERYMKEGLDAATPGTQASVSAAVANWQLLGLAKPSADYTKISDSVFKIVQLVLADSFKQEDCGPVIEKLATTSKLTADDIVALHYCDDQAQKVQEAKKAVQIQTQISKEVDPKKVEALKKEFNSHIQMLRSLQ